MGFEHVDNRMRRVPGRLHVQSVLTKLRRCNNFGFVFLSVCFFCKMCYAQPLQFKFRMIFGQHVWRTFRGRVFGDIGHAQFGNCPGCVDFRSFCKICRCNSKFTIVGQPVLGNRSTGIGIFNVFRRHASRSSQSVLHIGRCSYQPVSC